MASSLIYSLLCVLLDVLATSHGDQGKLQAEVLALRRQVQVLERQIKRVHWSAGDRMVLAALRDRIPRSGWAVWSAFIQSAVNPGPSIQVGPVGLLSKQDRAGLKGK